VAPACPTGMAGVMGQTRNADVILRESILEPSIFTEGFNFALAGKLGGARGLDISGDP